MAGRSGAGLEAAPLPVGDTKMSEAKHTPGPWVAYVDQPHPHSELDTDCVYSLSAKRKPVARMTGNCSYSREDARLIAAAPDLLEKAKALVERWDTPLWKDAEHTGKFIDDLRAAIAKAEGAQ